MAYPHVSKVKKRYDWGRNSSYASQPAGSAKERRAAGLGDSISRRIQDLFRLPDLQSVCYQAQVDILEEHDDKLSRLHCHLAISEESNRHLRLQNSIETRLHADEIRELRRKSREEAECCQGEAAADAAHVKQATAEFARLKAHNFGLEWALDRS